MVQIAILLLDLLAGKVTAQLVCDAINVVQAFETPENVKAVTSRLRELAVRLEPTIEKEVRAVARYFDEHPWAGEHAGNPDMGGNEQASFGSGPPVTTRPEPDQDQDIGGNVRARPEPPEVERGEPDEGQIKP